MADFQVKESRPVAPDFLPSPVPNLHILSEKTKTFTLCLTQTSRPLFDPIVVNFTSQKSKPS